ncbi:extracellular solute-binding protein [Paenibacillus camelliae]|uniref:extracellular solute-binding protein n=1 Tax=Paenibacillus camelliae TaxID=512410 RepID=UPI0020404595|nr:extracellular solute-binding protein [Paenibacillus camelliae]MCM3634905.1 extracellular solute-binding protein [Paenibacillus camelliae]
MKTQKLMLLLVLCLTVVFAGCGTSSGKKEGSHAASNRQGENASGDKVTLSFMHLWPDGVSTAQNNVVNDIIGQYEADNPNVKIKVEVLDNEQYKNKLKILSTSNSLPDVGVTWAAGFLQPYVEGGLFASLDDLLGNGLGEQFVSGTTDAFQVDGKTYGVPLEFNIAPIYYNKEIFANHNLEVPTTYAEFKQVIATLTANGIAPIALGNKDRWTGSLWYMYLADRIAGQEVFSSALAGKDTYMQDSLLQAASEVQQLVDLKAFNKGFNGLSNDEGKADFYNETAAMYLMGTWELANFTANEDVPQEFKAKVGFFKFPVVEGGAGDADSWVGGPGVGLFVAENSPVKDAAKDFVAYFVEKWGEIAVTDAGVIPATKVDTGSVELPALYVELFNEMNNASSITLYADVQLEADTAEVHLNQIQALFGKAATPEQFSEAHEQAINQ